MVTLEEFRTGQHSIPALDADDVPSCCFTCAYLMYKEFSVGFRDNFYYFCAYYWPDKLTQTVPSCLVEPS